MTPAECSAGQNKVVSGIWLLWIKLLWTSFTSLCVDICFCFSWVHTKGRACYLVYIPTAMCIRSSCSSNLPILRVVRHFNFSQPGACVVVSHCYFYLHFPDNDVNVFSYDITYFYILLGQSTIFPIFKFDLSFSYWFVGIYKCILNTSLLCVYTDIKRSGEEERNGGRGKGEREREVERERGKSSCASYSLS